jgi:hypothetical protein
MFKELVNYKAFHQVLAALMVILLGTGVFCIIHDHTHSAIYSFVGVIIIGIVVLSERKLDKLFNEIN